MSDRHDDEGSAVVEFVLIATPLFLPALLFFVAMHSTAMEELRVQNLARQTARAFVTADSISQGHQRIKFVLDRYSEIESSSSKRYGFTYNVSCSSERCLTPGSRVRIELYRIFSQETMDFQAPNQMSPKSQGEDVEKRKAVAVATGIVDKWRE